MQLGKHNSVDWTQTAKPYDQLLDFIRLHVITGVRAHGLEPIIDLSATTVYAVLKCQFPDL